MNEEDAIGPTFSPEVTRIVDAVLHGPGETPAALRRAVEARAASLGAADRPALPLPGDLVPYVDKAATHAADMTDEDIATLREAGYAEEAIFEITVAAALGAGLARLERGLALLRETP